MQGTEQVLDRLELKAGNAAELIKAMGGGNVRVMVYDNGRVGVVAILSGDRRHAQAEAERLLAHLQRKYTIVRD